MDTSPIFEWIERLRSIRPTVKPTVLPSSFFKFPPSSSPATVPPPVGISGLTRPFTIPTEWYNALLSPNVPVTIALVYATVVTLLNQINARRQYKPWAFSRTRLFKGLLCLHNAFLAVYSLWTFIGMWNALRASLESPRGDLGVAGFVDTLCKLHGPRGYGSAATYNATTSAWGFTNRLFHLAADGLAPESTDVGRMWNEGLAFYGWLFYISKFYEIVDTAIILLKGKKSSLLQTYHHAGAMLCMWAGIRFMSPPIWMFVLINSFIHFVMYTFYLFSALGSSVPVSLKRSLTTMQIAQFVVGAAFAFLHLFVQYQIPIEVPYLYHLGDVASAIPSDASSVASSVMATATAGMAAWLKKAAFRAAGREGLAENVLNEYGQTFGVDAVHAAADLSQRAETRYRQAHQWTNCLDTSGQVFAILLNCVYLVPLTGLFVRFFVKSYIRRIERRRRSSASQKAYIAGQSGKDAIKGVGRRLSEAFEDSQAGFEEIGDDAVLVDGDEVKKELAELASSAKETAKNIVNKTEKVSHDAIEKVQHEGSGSPKSSKKKKKNAHKTTSGTSQATPDKEDKVTHKSHGATEQEKAADTLHELAKKVNSNDQEPETTTKEDARTEPVNENTAAILKKESPEDRETSQSKNIESVKKLISEAGEATQSKAHEVKSSTEDTTSSIKRDIEQNPGDWEESVQRFFGSVPSSPKKSTVLADEEQEPAKASEKPTTTQVDTDEGAPKDEHTDVHVKAGESYADAVKEGSGA